MKLYDLLRMSPQLARVSSKSNFVQCLADHYVSFLLISEFCGLGGDFGIHRAKFHWYLTI